MILCKLCNGKEFTEPVLFEGTTEKYKNSRFSYAYCLTCGSINNLSSKEVDYTDYVTGTRISNLKVNRFARLLTENEIKKSDNILDYGCGNGALLLKLKEKGYVHIEGYEPFNPIYSLNQDNKYEVIYMVHVFEHIPNYSEFFNLINKITKPGTKIITIHPSSTRILKLNQNCPFQKYAVHAPFHQVIPSDPAVIKLFQSNGFKLKNKYAYDPQRSGIKDNNNVTALLAKSLGGTKESWLGASKSKKILALIKSPIAFWDKMFIHTKDQLVSAFVFEKSD